jgi:hypothetical protein
MTHKITYTVEKVQKTVKNQDVTMYQVVYLIDNRSYTSQCCFLKNLERTIEILKEKTEHHIKYDMNLTWEDITVNGRFSCD